MSTSNAVTIEFSSVLNYVVTGFSFVLSLIVKTLWGEIKDLKIKHEALKEEVTEMKVLVAGDYVKVDKFDATMDTVFKKLDRIDEKLNTH